MKISAYLDILEKEYGALVGVDGDRLLHVSNTPLPTTARAALAGYAPQLIDYFTTGEDAELDLTAMRRTLSDLGLFQMGNGRWTAAEGDHEADLLIAGVLEPKPQPRARRFPTKVTVEAEEVRPGLYRWHEEFGTHADPVFNGRRLRQEK